MVEISRAMLVSGGQTFPFQRQVQTLVSTVVYTQYKLLLHRCDDCTTWKKIQWVFKIFKLPDSQFLNRRLSFSNVCFFFLFFFLVPGKTCCLVLDITGELVKETTKHWVNKHECKNTNYRYFVQDDYISDRIVQGVNNRKKGDLSFSDFCAYT